MAEKSTVEVLREARELISDPERWTWGYFAYDAKGNMVEAREISAVCWCASGAILKVTVGGKGALAEATGCLRKVVANGDIVALNDGPQPPLTKGRPRYAPARHRKVLAAFDRAIALAEAEQQS